MSVDVLRTTAAREDLTRILVYFLDQNEPGVASRFADAYEATLAFIADFPELGFAWESNEQRLKNVRVKPIHGFDKYLVFYRYSGKNVYVLRVFLWASRHCKPFVTGL